MNATRKQRILRKKQTKIFQSQEEQQNRISTQKLNKALTPFKKTIPTDLQRLDEILVSLFLALIFLVWGIVLQYMKTDRDQQRRSRSSEKRLAISKLMQFQRIKLLGQGTFGKVYLTVNRHTQEELAVKEVVLHPQHRNRELSILANLSHPNIVELRHHLTSTEGQNTVLHLFMEKMQTTLASVLKDHRKRKASILPNNRKLIAFQFLKGLAYLQSRSVCHRDLKPPNLLLNTSTGEVKICDFGSAKIIEVRQDNVSYICSRYYRAPELILNSTSYGCEIDMWSAGCILVELMTLQPIFPGDSSLEQLIQIIKILGTPPIHLMQANTSQIKAEQLPNLRGTDWAKILKRYCPDVHEVDLIRKILIYDGKQRLKPLQALKHPYFADLPSFSEAAQLQQLFQFEDIKGKKNKKAVEELEQLYKRYQMKYSKEMNEETTWRGSEDEE